MHRNAFQILILLSLLLLVTGCGPSNNPVTSSPVITEFALPTQGGISYEITAGPDGTLWFTEIHSNQIGRISPTGTISEFPIPTVNSKSYGIALGSDNQLWFTEELGNQIGRITVPK